MYLETLPIDPKLKLILSDSVTYKIYKFLFFNSVVRGKLENIKRMKKVGEIEITFICIHTRF